MAQAQLPRTMRALRLVGYPRQLRVEEVPLPTPRSGQVLVRMDASPANPSDVMFTRGLYGIKRVLPTTPGFEGAGVAVYGKGMMAWFLSGKRVAVATQSPTEDGLWAEYAVVPAAMCVPIPEGISTEQAASSFVNPLTALYMIDVAKQGRHKALIHTAAASSLGKMLLRLALNERIPLICIVRREEQEQKLRGMGAELVLNSTAEDFDERLREVAKAQGATCLFDAVGGKLTGRILSCQPNNSRAYVYGALDESLVGGVDPGDLIFAGKRVEGLWLRNFLAGKSMLGQLSVLRSAQGMLANELKTEYGCRCSLEGAERAIAEYEQQMTNGKVLICPHKVDGESEATAAPKL